MNRNTKNLRVSCAIVAVCVVLQTASLKAQTTFTLPLSSTGTNGSLLMQSDGSFILDSSAVFQGYLYWNPGLASFASGRNMTASGTASVSFGWQNDAAGFSSSASGYGTTASGPYSLSFGYHSTASSAATTAFGIGTLASTWGATAFGVNSVATGRCSTSSGAGCYSSGDFSTASGYGTTTSSQDGFVLGRYNVGGGSGGTWVSTDPLFEVGNGTSGAPADAFVVYKNGTAKFQGPVSVPAGGDIPMFSGTN